MQDWDDLRAEMAADSAPIDLISSEAFWFTDAHAVREQLKDIGDIRVVLYLRRQDKYLQSLYKQGVTGGQRADFPTWLKNHLYRGDYLSVVRQWASAFGHDALSVRPYERAGGTVDLVSDFYTALGIDVSSELAADQHKVVNPSPRIEILDFIRALNHLKVRTDLLNGLVRRNMALYARSADILDLDACTALMESYAEGNRALIAEFYSDPVDPLFPPMTPFRPLPPKWDLSDPAFFDVTVEALGAMVEHARRSKETA